MSDSMVVNASDTLVVVVWTRGYIIRLSVAVPALVCKQYSGRELFATCTLKCMHIMTVMVVLFPMQ